MKNGETRRGPFSFRTIAVSAMPLMPPMPGPDHHAGAGLVLVAFRLPAGIVNRLRRRAHRIDDEVIDLALLLRLHPVVGIVVAVGQFGARHGRGNAGRQVGDVDRLPSLRTPLSPATSRRHVGSTPQPSGVNMPSPVTTTRLINRFLLAARTPRVQ